MREIIVEHLFSIGAAEGGEVLCHLSEWGGGGAAAWAVEPGWQTWQDSSPIYSAGVHRLLETESKCVSV